MTDTEDEIDYQKVTDAIASLQEWLNSLSETGPMLDVNDEGEIVARQSEAYLAAKAAEKAAAEAAAQAEAEAKAAAEAAAKAPPSLKKKLQEAKKLLLDDKNNLQMPDKNEVKGFLDALGKDILKEMALPELPATGSTMEDGTIYAGRLSGGKQLFAMPVDAGSAASGKLSLTFNKAVKYVEALNKEEYLGHSDWRLPTIKELNVLYYARNKGALTGTFNEAASGRDGAYWSCSPSYYADNSVKYKSFVSGKSRDSAAGDKFFIRLVR